MKKKWILFSFTALFFSFCSTKPKTDGQIVVDLAQKGATISPTMYGVFFEEINHAGEGGLYAELVQNRGFEEKQYPEGYTSEGDKLHPPPLKNHLSGEISRGTFRWNVEEVPGWSLESAGTPKAKMRLTKANPLDPSTPGSLVLGIPAGAGEVSLINSGYWGIGVKSGESYHLRFYLNALAYKGVLRARLTGSTGKELAVKPVRIADGAGWKEYRFDLVPGQTDAKAKLALSFNGEGRVQVDYVSLFPEKTFKNRPNGLRNDVATFLSELHPGFVRWPGGCVVEGITLNNRFEWKKTLGDPMKRTGEYDTWGYRNSYGFGYHEYLQFCEDIDAKAMFVCNVGIGCQARVGDACPDENVQFYIDDVLDAIEYAIGDPATLWGAKRSAAGHPEPFPLRYVEIGNENRGEVYNKRFDLFYRAIKSKYPQLTLISNHGLGNEVNKIAKTDMIDPHWYVAPDYFFKNSTLFDKQPRGDYKVYVGEYACNRGVGGGNMLAALSEAAFITGMERNGDLVTMASYAPLFENRNDRTWPVNLIWIDNLQVVGRSSYYVQKMVGENIPAWNLQTSVTPRSADGATVNTDGRVGVGTWSTQSEYRDFKITGRDGKVARPLVKDWSKLGQGWLISEEAVVQESKDDLPKAIWNNPTAGDFTLELKARKTGGDEGFMILFGMDGQNKNGYLFNIGGWGNSQTAVERVANGMTAGILSEQIPAHIETNKWYSVKIVKSSRDITLLLDGVKQLSYSPVNLVRQYAAGGFDNKSGEVIIKVVNAEEKSWRCSVNLKNAVNVASSGEIITLSAHHAEEENSFEEPLKISPVKTKKGNFSSAFDYEFGPNSFTILRIKPVGE